MMNVHVPWVDVKLTSACPVSSEGTAVGTGWLGIHPLTFYCRYATLYIAIIIIILIMINNYAWGAMVAR